MCANTPSIGPVVNLYEVSNNFYANQMINTVPVGRCTQHRRELEHQCLSRRTQQKRYGVTVVTCASQFRWTSSARSDAGRVREINEDACLDQPEPGRWAVADGMGGHAVGDLASRLVIDALSRLASPVSMKTLHRRRARAPANRQPSTARRSRAPPGAAYRQHGRRAARLRPLLRLSMGGRQPPLSVPRRTVAATHARSQPGGSSSSRSASLPTKRRGIIRRST